MDDFLDMDSKDKVIYRILAYNKPGVWVGIEKWKYSRIEGKWRYFGSLSKKDAGEVSKDNGSESMLFKSWEEAAIWCDVVGIEYELARDGMDKVGVLARRSEVNVRRKGMRDYGQAAGDLLEQVMDR